MSQTPPDLEKRPHTVTSPHGDRADEYYWLRDDSRSNAEVLAYLDAENAYADAVMQPLQALEDTLHDEIRARVKEDDSSVPVLDHGFWYYTRYARGSEYPVYARRAAAAGVDAQSIQAANDSGDFAGETVLLDVETLAQGHDFYSAFPVDISQDNRLMLWGEDVSGRRQYTLRIKDLASGETLADVLPGTSASAVWADDGKTLFYIENDAETLLTVRVKKHTLGTDVAADETVYEEADDSFYMGLSRSRDEQYLLITLQNTVSGEVRYTSAAEPGAFKLLAARERDIEYSADHFDGRWIIHTNADGAENFKIVTAKDDATARKHWQDWIAHDPAILIEDIELFDTFTAIGERSKGLSRIRIIKKDGASDYLAADEDAYTMHLAANPDPASSQLRYAYSSLTTPPTTYRLDLASGKRDTLKQEAVPGYDASRYQSKREWIPARDGTKIPVTLVYRDDLPRDGTAAMLLYGYGSYGANIDPYFDPDVVSLLDRGMVYAIAHIRGGQEMGRQWYEQGKMLHKMNTFTDFIDATRWLVDNGYAAKDRVAAMGRSAGGLLMGAIANLAPEDYRVIVSEVPFVDVVTTMLDPTIPLTTNEYDEWGNPEASAEHYAYMLAYSPYDNLKAQAYPAMFIGTGLWDSQVQYWEPAKYVARLRDVNSGTHPVIFRTNMDAGHGGKSGRYRAIREQAEIYAFMLAQLGINK
ncbi:MAG: S9 family peptidase [Cardiobacteriaceae bacterium]|nr:S9 family peptidase [Cardiobacteriaceae bacterium]